MNAIKVEKLTKVYKLYNSKRDRLKESIHPFKKKYSNDFYALKNVSFEIEKGETVGIIGKNGSGKSTLLKIITGVLSPTSGSVHVEGRISALLELGAGFNPELTGVENVYLNGTIMGYSRKEIDEKLEAILNFADIGKYAYQPVKNYSSGMFVRLAFAVAISVEPDILIVDEALAVGDIAFQAKCITKMQEIMKKGATILFVTHDVNTVKKLCQRCIYLIEGSVKDDGKASFVADMYLAEVRAMMNAENSAAFDANLDKPDLETNIDGINDKENLHTFDTDIFKYNANIYREGSGEVKILSATLIGEGGYEKNSFEYDEKVTLIIYIEFLKPIDGIAVGYHIRDNRNIDIIGSGLRLENILLLDGISGDKFLITFKTRLPLMCGDYNIVLVVTKPLILDRTARFIDIIQNAIVFSVQERKGPLLWNLVYIPNECMVKKV